MIAIAHSSRPPEQHEPGPCLDQGELREGHGVDMGGPSTDPIPLALALNASPSICNTIVSEARSEARGVIGVGRIAQPRGKRHPCLEIFLRLGRVVNRDLRCHDSSTLRPLMSWTGQLFFQSSRPDERSFAKFQ